MKRRRSASRVPPPPPPTTMTFWTYTNLQRLTAGRWLAPPADPAAAVTGITQDTRTLRPGQTYLVVVGENFDGHTFVDAAFAAGASLAIVQRDPVAADPVAADVNPSAESAAPHDDPAADSHPRLRMDQPILLVDDTVAALQQLAHAYRNVLADGGCTVISVSGSNGKTTTRHLIHHVLTACGLAGTQSPKSFNNHLGVPLTLLAADPTHDFVACEVGTNHPGEIDALARLVRPDIAVLTSLGEEHLEFFHDLEGVAREEAAILPHVRPGGLVLVPASAGNLLAPYYDVQEDVALLSITDDAGVPLELPLAGMHNRMNAALALAVARRLGAATTQAAEALKNCATPPGRMQVLRLKQNVTLINDAYNANPDSMRVALDHLSTLTGRKVAILGDMRELGEQAPELHQAIESYASEAADETILIGESFGADAWSADFAERVAARVRPGDTVLLKASRGMRLERLIPAIEARFPPEAPGRDKSRR